jgi:hypothetical protein
MGEYFGSGEILVSKWALGPRIFSGDFLAAEDN